MDVPERVQIVVVNHVGTVVLVMLMETVISGACADIMDVEAVVTMLVVVSVVIIVLDIA